MSNFISRAGEIFRPAPIIPQTTEKKYYGDEDYADYPSKAWDKVKMPTPTDQVEEAEIIVEHKALHIDKEIYQQLSDKLKEVIDGREYISNEQIDIECDCMTYTLNISTYVRYDYISAPDGRWSEISGLIPIWVELHSYDGVDMEERLNDFSIDELKNHI